MNYDEFFRRASDRLQSAAPWRRVPKWTQPLLYTGIVAGMLGLGIVFGSWTRACAGGACPSIAVLDTYRPQQALKVYAADGRLIQEVGVEHRTVVGADDIAPAVRAAFLAAEDKRFYQHGGIDFRRIFGALRANVLALGYEEGFSTITMQLARNVWSDQLPSGKTLRRKIREMRVALELEKTYEKNRILELYLNQVFLGGSAHGVEAGAQRYFGRSARELNPAEAALLAGMLPGPNNYDPRRFPDRAVRRRNLVLNVMRDQGYLSDVDAERWKAYPLVVSSREDFGDVAPYFVEWVRQQLYARFGNAIYERGYRVYTTLDLDMQLAAERVLEQQLERIEAGEFGPYHHASYRELTETDGAETEKLTLTPYLQGSLVTLDVDSGYVRAMVGGRDFDQSEWNRVTQAERQAGSTFKPFVFSAAIRANKPASHMIDDAPISIMQNDTMPWEPQNFDERFYGPMTIRRGLALSRNLVAIRLGREIGVQAVIGEAARYGLSTPLPRFPSLFIGSASVIPLEMASAYTSFATLGTQAAPVAILRVEDVEGNIVWEPRVRRTRVMDREHAWILTNMLQGVVDGGTATGAVRVRGQFPHPMGGKTGTTNDGTDVWFIGFTPKLVTTVWIGFDEPLKIKANAQGGLLAAPAWADYMREVYERRPQPAGWARPEGLHLARIDNTTGYLATDFCPRQTVYFEWFIPGTAPTEFCPYHNPLSRIITMEPRGESDIRGGRD
ncbi:MAG: PBP1A family penicillin-binding protein [Gemmatimonadota bacterium]|nr:PBP1A family penicillin-binding protein [Gemmatimonadota bacterium]